MKAMKVFGALALSMVLAVGSIGVYAASNQNQPAGLLKPRGDQTSTQESPRSVKNTVMYVTFGKDSYVMVDQKTGSAFTVTMPKEIYGIDGKRITESQLKKGNILEVYGNGIMLESYPGQYPGVSKIKVTKTGKASDADQYKELTDILYQEPDPSEPPSMNADYKVPQAAVSAMITRGGYTWSAKSEGDETGAVIACGAHPLQWKEINDLTITGATEVTLNFFPETPEKVTAVRWSSSLRGTETIPTGEAVTVEKKDGKYLIKDVKPGYVYQINGVWKRGTVEYAFLTK